MSGGILKGIRLYGVVGAVGAVLVCSGFIKNAAAERVAPDINATVEVQPVQGEPNHNAEKPIEITADEALEWHRNDRKYIAKKNVVVVQGDVTIKSDELIADYREGAKSSIDIYRLTATGNVSIHSRGNTAKSDEAVYDVDDGTAIMTGKKLIMISPDQTVTAEKSFTYYVPEGRVVADRNVVVTRGEDRLYTDMLTAYFKKNANGKRALTRLVADSNVKIVTPTETLTGDSGVYVASTNLAQITGNVLIKRDKNILEGEKAQVNLTTNVSAIIGNEAAGERVRGVFYPSKGDDSLLQTSQ